VSTILRSSIVVQAFRLATVQVVGYVVGRLLAPIIVRLTQYVLIAGLQLLRLLIVRVISIRLVLTAVLERSGSIGDGGIAHLGRMFFRDGLGGIREVCIETACNRLDTLE
jgi:hypothetical protein